MAKPKKTVTKSKKTSKDTVTKKSKHVSKTQKKVDSLKGTREVWLGVAIIITILVFGLFMLTQRYNRRIYNSPSLSPTFMPSNTPTTSDITITPTTVDLQTHQEVVQPNDNFWKISKRVCGTGVYYLSIQQANGYGENRSLHEGETVTVRCAY
jgi:nucleoid-associated protein YgaU